MYWYELIHRPIGMGTHPIDFIAKDETHVNRTGFMFGKVAYPRPLSVKVMNQFNLEPVHRDGLIEISMITQDFLNTNRIKTTPDVIAYLIENEMIPVIEFAGWRYIDLSELESVTIERKKELKTIYKKIRYTA